MNIYVILIGAAIGALLGSTIALPVGEARGRAAIQQEIRTASTAIELEREKADAAQSKMSDRDFCVAALTARGLPVDTCDVLRGVQAE